MDSNKRRIWRVAASAVLFAIVLVIKIENEYARLLAFALPYFLVGGDVLWRAISNLLHGELFDENFLMSIATVGAFATRQYPEAVAVMLFYQIGEMFQDFAVGKSRKSITRLMDLNPEYANIESNGEIISVFPDTLNPGDIIVVRPGEKIPLDGTVILGNSFLDTSALTGETAPRSVGLGESVPSGCVNLDGLLKLRVERKYADSTVSKILELVETSAARKTPQEKFITKFARIYTPAVVGAAVLLALLPPLLVAGQGFTTWLNRALVFLVISCPCALVLSVPLTFFGGLGAASKLGILIKGGNYIEALSRAEAVAFDKTGTLTKGIFEVVTVVPEGMSTEELVSLAALASAFSNHPISKAVRDKAGSIDYSDVNDARDIPGRGVEAKVGHSLVIAGNAALMEERGIEYVPATKAGTLVYVAKDGRSVGHLVIADEIRQDAACAVEHLKELGIRDIVMLTGDNDSSARQIASQIGVKKVFAGLMPGDKVRAVEDIKERLPKGKTLIFAGDGINDAPVLARSDVGIAMGGLGSGAAIEAADVVIMSDEPSKISKAIKLSKYTKRVVAQNVALALGVKGIVLLLGALGYATMWSAVFADVGVSVIAVLNALRAQGVSKLL